MRYRLTVKRLSIATLLVVVGSFFLVGCSDDHLGTLDADETVFFGRTSRIRGLDPAVAGEVSSSMAIAKIYEGLLQYDYLSRPYKVVPLLAEAMPEVSEGGLIYTFKIRKGIFFQDDPCFPEGKGRELTATDFVYSMKRVADAKNASSGFWVFNERLVGINAFHEESKGESPTDYDMEVEGIQVLDRYTLQLKLTKPYPQLLYVLAMHYAFAVPREAVEYYGSEFGRHPVGSGPYYLSAWKRNSRIEFVRNPKWAETGRVETYPETGSVEQQSAGLLRDAGKQLPFIDRVVQFVVDDSTTSWMMFLAGQFSFSGIDRDNWDAVITGDEELNEELEKRGIELLSSPTLDVYYLGFNWDDPVLGHSADPEQDHRNRKLRQALSCAYDFEQMNRFMNYRLHPISSPVPDQLAGSLKNPSPFRFDLEKAKQLLLEAGYPEGIDRQTGRRLELTIELGSASSNARQMMELLADMFRKIGVVLNGSYNTWPAFIEKMNRRQAQMFQLGWVADYPDAENFLQLFYSKNETPGPNHANYRNAEFDRLYEEVRIMQDSPERTAKYEKMAKIVVEDCPWIFLYQPKNFSLKHRWVENYVPHDFPYGMGKYQRINRADEIEWNRTYGDKKMNISGQE